MRDDFERFVYEFVGGEYNGKRFSIGDLEMLDLITGYNADLTEFRACGILCHREELDGQPIIAGYVGPMYDGMRGKLVAIRYESPGVYEMMSN